jgi:hypothetical protein
MTKKEIESLSVGTRLTILERPLSYNVESGSHGLDSVDYPYNLKITKLKLTGPYPSFTCEKGYGWSLHEKNLDFYTFSFSVGNWITITKGSNWSKAMDKFIGRTVQITKVDPLFDCITFDGFEGWSWCYVDNHFRPATKDEINAKKWDMSMSFGDLEDLPEGVVEKLPEESPEKPSEKDVQKIIFKSNRYTPVIHLNRAYQTIKL